MFADVWAWTDDAQTANNKKATRRRIQETTAMWFMNLCANGRVGPSRRVNMGDAYATGDHVGYNPWPPLVRPGES